MIRQMRPKDAVEPCNHRVRDELELYHMSTYQYLKDIMCAKRCKFGGRCELCPAGELLRYARRDEERISELIRETEDY